MLIHDVAVVGSDGMVGMFGRSDGRRELRVPFGMEGIEATKALAMLYKCFVVFRRTSRSLDRLAALDGVERQSQDGVEFGEDGFTFCDALGLDELFDRTDPTRLLSLCERRAKSAANAYTRIDRQLQFAIFDADGVPYLERAYGPRREVRYGTGEIVGLYCFLAEDFYRQFLGVDVDSPWGQFASDGTAIAAEFRHRYLNANASLYSGDSHECEHTLQRLRHTLQVIDRNTPFRNADYRTLYDALDRYLHGGIGGDSREGLVWGVNNFWAVWESACLLHAAQDDYKRFVTCDFEHLPAALANSSKQQSWLLQRQTVFAHNEIARRPDLVIESDSGMRIVDFKFYANPPAERPKSATGAVTKLERDFLNIEIYGLLLQNHLLRSGDMRAENVALELWFPGEASSSTVLQGSPRWNPPLSVVTLPTTELLQNYSHLYGYDRELRWR
jgi:hypothetical protein